MSAVARSPALRGKTRMTWVKHAEPGRCANQLQSIAFAQQLAIGVDPRPARSQIFGQRIHQTARHRGGQVCQIFLPVTRWRRIGASFMTTRKQGLQRQGPTAPTA